MSPPAALSVRNLRISIAGVELVHGVDLAVIAGECLAIVGESGSGKTLTANALLGLNPRGARVTADEVVVVGTNTAGFGERHWRSLRGRVVALVSQDALVALDPMRRVGTEVAEPIRVHERFVRGEQLQRRVIQLLRDVAVPDPEARARQYSHELSGGLRQRALIASALAGAPRLLIADEPTTALDATVQRQVLDLLDGLRRTGIALVIVSHDLGLVARLADRVAVMRAGQIVETGPTRQVLDSPRHDYTRALLAAAPTARGPRPAATGAVVLEARDVSRVFSRPGAHPTLAVDTVSLRLHEGRTLGVVGESGSGKSTLARMLVAADRPDSGVVLLDGTPWSSLSERDRRPLRGGIQLIEQSPSDTFDPRWTVRRLLGEAVALAGDPTRDRADRMTELLRQVGLDESFLPRHPAALSGGQRQRVAIARALARRPRILVCDEPVSALDVSVQAQVLGLLERLQRELGLSMVFISHDLAVIAQVSDDIIVMKDGMVVESGVAHDVLARPVHPFTKELLG